MSNNKNKDIYIFKIFAQVILDNKYIYFCEDNDRTNIYKLLSLEVLNKKCSLL